jgi:catechol 2,3-dioxygenase-like lactoylglutathione lyase family enzyme
MSFAIDRVDHFVLTVASVYFRDPDGNLVEVSRYGK